jgi:hypothetical protein
MSGGPVACAAGDRTVRCRVPLSGGLPGPGEFEALIELGQRDLDSDFGHRQNRAASEQGPNPTLAFTGEDDGGRFVLFQHDVALD